MLVDYLQAAREAADRSRCLEVRRRGRIAPQSVAPLERDQDRAVRNLKGFGVALRPWRDACSASTEHGIESRLTDANQTPLLLDNAKGNPPATIGNRQDLVAADKPHSGEATKPAIAG